MPAPLPTLYGRADELAVLRGALDAATQGSGAAVLIAGEPGIGKTRIAEELAAEARSRGALVLWGRCLDDEGAPSFWPWQQILRGALQQLPSVAPATAGRVGILADLVPEAVALAPDQPPPSPLDAVPARFRMFDAVAGFLADLTRVGETARPLLLVLDDLHWADQPSLALLSFLAQRLREAPLLVAGAYRDTALTPGHPLAQAATAIARDPAARRIELRGLDAGAVAALMQGVSGVAPAMDTVTAVLERTEGNPFFVVELLRTARDSVRTAPLPASVREMVAQRLEGLSPACREALQAGAVLGREFSLPLLSRISEQTMPELLELLSEAETAQLVETTDQPGRFRFVHALIREALQEALSAGRRARLHLAAAEALESRYARDPAPYLPQLAYHFGQALPAGAVARAVHYARLAGEQAFAQHAHEEAARLFEAALVALDALDPADAERREESIDAARCDLLISLGEAVVCSGSLDRGRDAVRSAAQLAVALGSAQRLARAAIAYGVEMESGRVDAFLVDLLQKALALQPEEQSSQHVRLLARLALALHWSPEPETGRNLSATAVAQARRLEDPVALCTALEARHFALSGPTLAAERLEVSGELVRLAAACGDPDLSVRAPYWRIGDLIELGDVAAADAEIANHARLVAASRQPLYGWAATLVAAMRAMLAGAFADAERLAMAAFQSGSALGRPGTQGVFGIQLFLLRWQQGRLAEVEPLVRAVIAQSPDQPYLRCALALLLCETGRIEEARTELDRLAAQSFADLPRSPQYLVAASMLADVCATVGDAPRAALLYALIAPSDGRALMVQPTVACLGPAARYLGLLAATMAGTDEETWTRARRHFADAIALAERMDAAPYVALCQADFARAIIARLKRPLAAGRTVGRSDDAPLRAEAAALLQAGLERASTLGMAGLERRAGQLLQELAQLPPAQPSAGTRQRNPAGLTPREIDVLRLLAAGKANNEIAEDLTLSVYTVVRHVFNIYGKIGVRRRAEATAYALRHGLDDPAGESSD